MYFLEVYFKYALSIYTSTVYTSEVYFKHTLQKNHDPFTGFIFFSGLLCGYSSNVCRLKSHSEDLLYTVRSPGIFDTH